MIAEFKAFFTLFQEGKELTNSKVWKNRQNAGNGVIAVLTACAVIANGFGYEIHVDDETLQAAGMGIAAVVAIVNNVLTTITSSKVGVKPK
jgi:hypothetical protein